MREICQEKFNYLYLVVRSTPIREDLNYGMHGGVYIIVRSTLLFTP